MSQNSLYIEENFENIFRLWGPKVYAVCMHHIQNRELVRDMVQDIFKSLWERRESLTISGSLEHYLTRAAKLKVLEYFRNETLRRENLKKHFVFSEEDNSTVCEIYFTDLVNNMWKELRHLPDKTQQIFRHSREKGLSNKEIAFNMHISEKTVEYHISRALDFLRKKSSCNG